MVKILIIECTGTRGDEFRGLLAREVLPEDFSFPFYFFYSYLPPLQFPSLNRTESHPKELKFLPSSLSKLNTEHGRLAEFFRKFCGYYYYDNHTS